MGSLSPSLMGEEGLGMMRRRSMTKRIPTDPQGKRPAGTTRRNKKKSTGSGASKNSIGPLVDKDGNPLLVPLLEEGENE